MKIYKNYEICSQVFCGFRERKNKRNITGGEIHLNQIDLNDKVDDDAAQDYEDNLIKVLDLQPETTKIFIESKLYLYTLDLQNGTFI